MIDLKVPLDRALAALLARRNPAGYWEGRLASSPLATAVALCALDENDSYKFKFEKPGVYKVFCGIHPNMKQTITVR